MCIRDRVEIVGLQEKSMTSTCTGVEMFRKILDIGEAGENVGILLRGIEKTDIKRGMVICKPGSVPVSYTHLTLPTSDLV